MPDAEKYNEQGASGDLLLDGDHRQDGRDKAEGARTGENAVCQAEQKSAADTANPKAPHQTTGHRTCLDAEHIQRHPDQDHPYQ